MINEAIYTLYEGVGSVDAIDTAISSAPIIRWAARACRLHRPRYLPVGDAGVARGTGRLEIPPCPLLVKYVEAGWLGRKTKRGFYDYRGDKPVPTR